MIRINCFLATKEGRREEALEAAKALTAVSLTQDGCVAYDVFESATRPGVLVICETWRDQAALDAHSASEPFKKYVGVMSETSELKIESFNF
ncbi:MAG: antibiotic biosynthesis monooxygenase [Kiritimatiellae bacterium]|nr:antibiotic biosynthesis monooxygenase [Kiritimatiellia bacterium]